MANAGEHHFEAAQLPRCLSIRPLAAEADGVPEGRDCFHTDWQAPSPGDKSAGLAAQVWLLCSWF